MVSDEFKKLIDERERIVKSGGSAGAKRSLNKKIRESIGNLSEAILAYRLLPDNQTIRCAKDYITNLDSWIQLASTMPKHKRLTSVLELLKPMKEAPGKVIEALHSVKFFGSKSVVLRIMINEDYPAEMVNELLQDIWLSADLSELYDLSELFVDNEIFINRFIELAEGRDLLTYYNDSNFGSELSQRIIQKITGNWDIRSLFKLLYRINRKYYNMPDFPGNELIENWLADHFEFTLPDIEPHLILFDYKVEQRIKIDKLRQSLIEEMASNLLNRGYLFLLISSLKYDDDLRLIRKRNPNIPLIEWAKLNMRDLRALWYDYRVSIEDSGPGITDISDDVDTIIENYFSTIDSSSKNRCFWLLKWKIFSGKDISIYDERLGRDERFMNYYSQLVNLGILEEKYMYEIFRFPSYELLKKHGKEKLGEDISGSFKLSSPLTEIGYHVGHTSGLTVTRRNELLDQAFHSGDKSFLNYGWGRAGSPSRLQSIAYHLMNNIWLRDGMSQYDQAVEDWHNDLDYLKTKYYDDRLASEFVWPFIRVLESG